MSTLPTTRTSSAGPLLLVIVSNLIAGVALLVALAALERAGATCRDACMQALVEQKAVEAGATMLPVETVSETVPQADPHPPPPAEPPQSQDEPSDELVVDEEDPIVARLRATPADPPPEVRGGVREALYDRHYWVSDEWNLQLFRRHVTGLGGAYVGIGTDQNYLLMSWVDPEVAWVVDYDQMVLDLHGVYADFFRAAKTPKEFIHFWSPAGQAEALALLRARPDPEASARGIAVYKRAIGRVRRRLTLLVPKLEALEVPSHLTDQAHYDRVRNLVLAGRVRHVLVDLTGRRGLRGIGALAHELEIPLRVLYLSNAEQYWKYGPDFRQNIAALPFDERSVVLRTVASHKTNGDFRYNLHYGLDFQAQLRDPKVDRVYEFVVMRKLDGFRDVDFSITGKPAGAPVAVAAATVPPSPAPANSPPSKPAPVVDPKARFATLPIHPCFDEPMGMACITGGAFVRGVDKGDPYARPAEKVWLQTFYMDRNEVTYAEYKACVADKRCPVAGPRYGDFNDPAQPINGVSWHDAVAYCAAQGKHLPTEAEWEKAARGTDGRLYPWGNEPATCKRAVLRDASGAGCGIDKRFGRPEVGKPAKIGSRPPNPYGLFDMAGNSYEWVADWFVIDYRKCGEDCRGIDPKGPCAGQETCHRSRKKVVRGGSWFWPAGHATTVHRRAHVPDNDPFHHFGFRCAASFAEARALLERG